jgi:hypothetical protein
VRRQVELVGEDSLRRWRFRHSSLWVGHVRVPHTLPMSLPGLSRRSRGGVHRRGTPGVSYAASSARSSDVGAVERWARDRALSAGSEHGAAALFRLCSGDEDPSLPRGLLRISASEPLVFRGERPFGGLNR